MFYSFAKTIKTILSSNKLSAIYIYIYRTIIKNKNQIKRTDHTEYRKSVPN